MSADSRPAYWMAVLPWLQLPSEVRLGDVRFVPIETAAPGDAVAELGPVSADASQVLRSFRLSHQSPINHCTLAVPDGYDPTVPSDGATRAHFYQTTSLLMLCAIAANRYGEHNTWNANASMFSLRIAAFAFPLGGYLPLYRRRHDGSASTVGAKWGNPLFYIPDECNPPHPPRSVDKDLASAIGSLDRSHSLSRRLRLSLPFFGWANTLAETSSWEMEIIALVAAFEKLLGTGSGPATARKLQELFAAYRSVAVGDACRKRTNIRATKAQQPEPVRRVWIQELYHIRNSSAHPRPFDTEKLGWSPGEHLAMGAFLFPLVVKLLLARENLYDLDWDDKAACDAVDSLLAETDWFIRRDEEDSAYSFETPSVWAATLLEAQRQRHLEEVKAVARQLYEEHFGSQDTEGE